jgi:hypothetical protein
MGISELEFYEGAWFNSDSNSYLYSKIHNGQLLIPYCYQGDSHLTAHYFDLKKSGQYLVGQFEWFISDISGFMFMKTIDNNLLEGAWWTSNALLTTQQNKYWEPPIIKDNMHPMRWERLVKVSFDDYPEWAKKYFLEL